MRIRSLFVLLFIGLLADGALAGAGRPLDVIVCYPGGSVSQTDARNAMDSMLRVVERIGHWPANQFVSSFTTKADECRRLLSEKSPQFAITSLGLYLDQRDAAHLLPVAQPRIRGRSTERYRVVAAKGRFTGIDGLKGRRLGGTVLEDPAFVERIVFAGRYKLDGFDVRPSNQALRALRAVDQGELDAVILDEQQYAGLASLPLRNGLDVVFTSEEIPLMGVVGNATTSSADDRTRFVRALEDLCADAEGQKLCGLFGIEAFRPVDPRIFDPMIRLWASGA